tara:strand:- start:248 stop:370 length:123 start_codon:yes stop_codon:yes gene_type:complete
MSVAVKCTHNAPEGENKKEKIVRIGIRTMDIIKKRNILSL